MDPTSQAGLTHTIPIRYLVTRDADGWRVTRRLGDGPWLPVGRNLGHPCQGFARGVASNLARFDRLCGERLGVDVDAVVLAGGS
jgi:hypothetical protein